MAAPTSFPPRSTSPRRLLAGAAVAVLAVLAATVGSPATPAEAARHVTVAPTGMFHLYEVSHNGQWLMGKPDAPTSTSVILDRASGTSTPVPDGDAYRVTGFVRDNPDLRLEIDTTTGYAFTALWLHVLSTGARLRVDTDSAGTPLFAQWQGPGGTYLPRIAASPASVSRDGAYVAMCVDDALHGTPWLRIKNLVSGSLKDTGVACGVDVESGVLSPEISYDGRVVHLNGSLGDRSDEGQTVPDYFLADRLVFPLGATVKVRTVNGWGSMTRDGKTLFMVRATRADGAAQPKGKVGAYSVKTKKTKALSGRYAIYGNAIFWNFSAFDKASFRGRYVVYGNKVAVIDRTKHKTKNLVTHMTAAGYPPTAYVQSRISGDGKVVFALTPSSASPMTGRAYVAISGW